VKLAVSMLEHLLAPYLRERHFVSGKDELLYRRFVFYRRRDHALKGNTLESGVLYLAEGGELPEKIRMEKQAALICVGQPPRAYRNETIHLLVLCEGTDLLEISNLLLEYFEQYDRWEEGLRKTVHLDAPFSAFVQAADCIFGNTVNIMNSDFVILASSTSAETLAGILDVPPTDEEGRMHVDIVNSFKNDKDYNEVMQLHQAFIYPQGILPVRTLCTNLFVQGSYTGRVIVMEERREFASWEGKLLEIFTAYVQEAFERMLPVREEEDLCERVFLGLLQGEAYNRSEMTKILSVKGWKEGDTYLCVCLLPSRRDYFNKTLEYFSSEIRKEFPDSGVMQKDGRISLVVNLRKYGNEAQSFIQEFVYFLREGNFRAGFGGKFTELEYLKEYYRQAEIALDYGVSKNETIWQHYFSDYALDYVLDKATEDLAGNMLGMPELLELSKMDRENNTRYYETLKVYLENNQNAVHAAKQLFIHRGTLLYRLDKILEMTGIDLKDMNTVLYLLLSFRLLDGH
jgi:hypothetical protein